MVWECDVRVSKCQERADGLTDCMQVDLGFQPEVIGSGFEGAAADGRVVVCGKQDNGDNSRVPSPQEFAKSRQAVFFRIM